VSGLFVVDNSIIMSWCFRDEISRYADAILERLENATALVPAIWPLEIGNALLVAERKKRLSQADSKHFLSLLAALPILVEQEAPERMLKEILILAREQNLSTYDASYLDLALRKEVPIATLDKMLLAAAKRCHVPVVKK
jgi:predicted nucleic acid-binding protein